MARVGQGRTGNSLPVREVLEFQLAHARARDAVHYPFAAGTIANEIEQAGLEAVVVKSRAHDRAEYLRNPGLGRQLDPASRGRLDQCRAEFDAVFIVADGLSALAVHRHAVELLQHVVGNLEDEGWKLAPVVIVEQGRVAVSDEIGEALGASLAVILIGERPGLSSPDSLGVYLTWGPHVGRTDAERNCISNIRPEGLKPAAAAELLLWLMNESRARRISGVMIREREKTALPFGDAPGGTGS
jgi:ethanolamine ammonia-lyase small subunit